MSQPTLRSQLAHILKVGNTIKFKQNLITNRMLNEVDKIVADYWWHLSDMGMTKKQFNYIVRQMRKRL